MWKEENQKGKKPVGKKLTWFQEMKGRED